MNQRDRGLAEMGLTIVVGRYQTIKKKYKCITFLGVLSGMKKNRAQ